VLVCSLAVSLLVVLNWRMEYDTWRLLDLDVFKISM
jgi:hypothetical protein